MCPAAGLDNPTADEQFIEPGIAVGVNDAAKVLQMRLRMLAFTIGRVEKQRRRRPRAGEWPLIADIGPQPAGLGLAGARRENRHRRVFDTPIWANRPAPARPRAIAWSGAGAATTVSQTRHDSFSRMCRTTLNRPGT